MYCQKIFPFQYFLDFTDHKEHNYGEGCVSVFIFDINLFILHKELSELIHRVTVSELKLVLTIKIIYKEIRGVAVLSCKQFM